MAHGFDHSFHLGRESCCFQHARGITLDCGDLRNLSSLLAASGSSVASPRGLEGYGPQRRRPSLKVFGGGPTPSASEPTGSGEALSSSTSERPLRGTADFRTFPGSGLGQVLMEAMEE